LSVSDRYNQLASLLFEVERELRQMQLWADESPPAAALLSSEPFSIDVLTFSQWLQFVFLPKMYQTIELAGELPESCSVAPMAEEFFKAERIEASSMIRHLGALDRFICGQ